MAQQEQRPLRVIVQDIFFDWEQMDRRAMDLLPIIGKVVDVEEEYDGLTGKQAIGMFLSYSSQWRSEVATKVKKELRQYINI